MNQPEMGSRSVVTGRKNPCGTRGQGRLTRDLTPRFAGTDPSTSPVWQRSTITAPDPGWATDLTHILLQKCSLYPVALSAPFSSNMLNWNLTGSLDTEFCLEALATALTARQKPQIFHSDQGSSSPHPAA